HVILKWTADWKGRRVYGAPTGGSNYEDPVLYVYDATKQAHAYVWTSHPITNQLDRAGMIRDLVIPAQGRGQVKVHGITEQGIEVRQANSEDDSRVTSVRLSFGQKGDFSQIRLRAQGLSVDDPAPEIHELRFQINSREKVAR